jgi:hypothetical protein
MASAIAGGLALKAYKFFAKDRNIIIPLDNVSDTKIMTDSQIKKEYCPPKKSRKSNLQRATDRMSEVNLKG